MVTWSANAWICRQFPVRPDRGWRGTGRATPPEVDVSIAICVSRAPDGGRGCDPELSPRLVRLPARLAATGLFDGPSERYSSCGRCAVCRHRGECGFCPVSLAHGPGPEAARRVPDHLCAFNRVQIEMRARYQRAVRRASSSGVG